jgi:hypothetical protein
VPGPTPTPRARLLAATAIGLASALVVFAVATLHPDYISDIDQLWYAARLMLSGRDPYYVIGVEELSKWHYPLHYPLTAVVPAIPFAPLPVLVARLVVAGGGSGLLAWFMTRRSFAPLALLLGLPLLWSLRLVQWAPLFAAAMVAPAMAWVVACKPNLGLVVLAGASERRTIWISAGAGIVMLAVSLVMQPHWIAGWIEAVKARYMTTWYVARPGGVLMLLALFRWRRPEARAMVALALIPGTPGPQEALLLYLMPVTLRQACMLAILSHGVWPFAEPASRFGTLEAYAARLATLNIWFIYVPLLAVMLRLPNEGTIPWLWRNRSVKPNA